VGKIKFTTKVQFSLIVNLLGLLPRASWFGRWRQSLPWIAIRGKGLDRGKKMLCFFSRAF